MNRKFNKVIPVALGLSLFLLPLSGCTTVNRTRVTPAPTPAPQIQGVTPPSGGINRLGTTATPAPSRLSVPAPENAPVSRAEKIKNQLISIRGVNNVNVAIVDNVALVGYKPTDASTDIPATNKAITDKVKSIDPAITNVAVSGAKDMTDRIGSLAQKLIANPASNEVRAEAASILQKIVPSVQ